MTRPNGGYYSDVSGVWTTTSCSARHGVVSYLRFAGFALLALGFSVRASAQLPDPPVPSIFPLAAEWTAVLGRAPVHRPASDGFYAYVPLRDGWLAAVSLVDGVVQWVTDQRTDFEPTVGGGLLFVVEGAQVRALRPAMGVERWRLDLPAPVSAPALWESDWLIISLANGIILAYDGRDGRPVWSQRVAAAVLRPTIAGGRLLVPQQDGHVAALELTTGRLLWERQLGGTPAEIRALDDRLYLGTSDNFLYAMDLVDGRIRWRWRTGGDIVGAPVVTPEAVYFVSLDNQLRALELRTGVQLWKRDLPTRAVGGPIQLSHVLMVPGRMPTLHVFYVDTGEPAGQILVPTELAAPPVVSRSAEVDDVAFAVLTGEGQLLAHVSASPTPLDSLSYLPGNNPTVVALLLPTYMPGWPASAQADTLVALSPLPGLEDHFVALTPFADTPGRRFVPPLLPRLARLPGHEHGVPALAPFSGLPGVPVSLAGVGPPPVSQE